jgi:hypothetical protein
MTCSTIAWPPCADSTVSIGSGLLVKTAGGVGEQVTLVVRVHVLDQAHDQPGADLAVLRMR